MPNSTTDKYLNLLTLIWFFPAFSTFDQNYQMKLDTIDGWLNRHTDGMPQRWCILRIWLTRPYLDKVHAEGNWKPKENCVECEIVDRKGFNQVSSTSYYFANPESDDDFVYYQLIDREI